jgi:hypothetical protein
MWSPVEPVYYDLVPGTASNDILVAVGGNSHEPLVEHERLDPQEDSSAGELDYWNAILDRQEAELLAKSGEGAELEEFRRQRHQITQEISFYISTYNNPEYWPQYLGDEQLSPDGRYLYYEILGAPPRGLGEKKASVQQLYVADVRTRPVKVWKIDPPVSGAFWHPNGRQLVVRVWESWRLDDPDDPQARLGVVTFP